MVENVSRKFGGGGGVKGQWPVIKYVLGVEDDALHSALDRGIASAYPGSASLNALSLKQ